MDDHVATPSIDPTGRLSRRMALRTYAPPALAVLAVASTGSLGQSGRIRPNAGRGNGSEGNPDPDPGNSGGKNQGGDGVVPVPGNGGGKKK